MDYRNKKPVAINMLNLTGIKKRVENEMDLISRNCLYADKIKPKNYFLFSMHIFNTKVRMAYF